MGAMVGELIGSGKALESMEQRDVAAFRKQMKELKIIDLQVSPLPPTSFLDLSVIC